MSASLSSTTGLGGIRVLEVGRSVATSYAAKLLADMGTEVIKVEPPEGDRARHRGPFAPTGEADPDASGLFLALNTGKRSVVIGPDRRELLEPLVDQADIVIVDQRPERPEALGFEPVAALARRRSQVICAITPFGLTGPYADFEAEELTVAHGGGWAYLSPGALDDPGRPPLKVFGHQAEFHAATAAATLCLAAYLRAERTGVGDVIDLSSMAYTAGMLEAALIGASYMGENPSRLGSRLLNPWGIFPGRSAGGLDPELIFLVTVEQDQWERLVELMGHPEWTREGLFDTVEQRLENEDLLRLYLTQWTAGQDAVELWHDGQASRICFAPVFTMAGMERQEHLRARGFFQPIDHPGAGSITHLGAPFRTTPSLHRRPGPAPPLDPEARPGFSGGRPRAAVRPETTPQRPLAGIRVLDLSWVWAGPYCTLHLAHLGAEVIKIESTLRPGLGRRLPLHPADVEPSLNTSAYFNQWEQGKRSCQVDLQRPEGIDLIKAMVARSDVVVENFATGVMDRLGLGYQELQVMNPDVIVASISGYGSEGPLKNYMGYGPTTGPLSGLSSLTGYPDDGPRELGISIGDPAAGITTAFAICAALVTRDATGEGCYIDTSLWEATAVHTVEGWMAHAMTGRTPDRMGNRDPVMAPHGCYRTAPEPGDRSGADGNGNDLTGPDGFPIDEPDDPGRWITIACADDRRWRELARVVDPALIDDPRFGTGPDRKANEDALDEILAAWAAGHDRWDLTKRLQSVGVAAFPSMSPMDLLGDEHLWERGFFERLDHPEVGDRVHVGMPWRSRTAPNGVEAPAPLIGEHTDEVLRSVLGMTDGQIARFRERRVLE